MLQHKLNNSFHKVEEYRKEPLAQLMSPPNNSLEEGSERPPLSKAPIGPPPPISKFHREGDDTRPDHRLPRKPRSPLSDPHRPDSHSNFLSPSSGRRNLGLPVLGLLKNWKGKRARSCDDERENSAMRCGTLFFAAMRCLRRSGVA